MSAGRVLSPPLHLKHDLSAGVTGFTQLLRFAGFLQGQHGFDVHFDCSFYDQAGNGRQLIAVWLRSEPSIEERTGSPLPVDCTSRGCPFDGRFKGSTKSARSDEGSAQNSGPVYCRASFWKDRPWLPQKRGRQHSSKDQSQSPPEKLPQRGMNKAWLRDWPWETITAINSGLCKEKNALHKPTGCRANWFRLMRPKPDPEQGCWNISKNSRTSR